MSKNRKVVVFGGSGFLGSHVADALTEQKFNVTVFDLNESKYLKNDQHMVIGNILDSSKVDLAGASRKSSHEEIPINRSPAKTMFNIFFIAISVLGLECEV